MLFPLFTVVVIAFIYREDLGARTLLVYACIWCLGLVGVLWLDLSPGIFVVLQYALAIAMLIHVEENPDVPLR